MGFEIAETQNVSIRNSFIRNDEINFRDMDRGEGLFVNNIDIQHNTFQNGMIRAGWSCEDWGPHIVSERNMTIDYNTWQGKQAHVRWGPMEKWGLTDIRSALGIEMHSTQNDGWDEWKPAVGVIPAWVVAPAFRFSPQRHVTMLYDMMGRRVAALTPYPGCHAGVARGVYAGRAPAKALIVRSGMAVPWEGR